MEAQERIVSRRNQGDKRESLMDYLLDEGTETRESVYFHGTKTKLANFVGAVMQGASDTTSLAMRTNIMFLATHPSVQTKAQKEIDALCGVERMPSFADFEDLPYINCIVKEGLRMRPM